MIDKAKNWAPRDVCEALSIAHGTLNTWLRTGMVKNLDAQNAEQGKARSFTTADVFALAICAEAARCGLLNRLLGSYAKAATDDYFLNRETLTRMYIHFYDDDVVIAYDEAAQRTRPKPNAKVILSIYLAAIFEATAAKLSEIEKKRERERRIARGQ